MTAPDKSFVERVARTIAQPSPKAPRGVRLSILAQAARVHGQRPLGDEATAPTGFDPNAVALFEGTVEMAYLAATSDGPIDATEDGILRAIIGIGCDGKVSPEQIEAMFEGLRYSLKDEGPEARIQHISKMIHKRDHQLEVLRIAAIMARASGGVRASERALLEKLSAGFGLAPSAVDEAVAEAEETLGAI